MRQTKCTSSYSQFRRQNPNYKQVFSSAIDHSEIDELTLQLESISSSRLILNQKEPNPNGMIEDEDEEQLSYWNGDKKLVANGCTKKLKSPICKLEHRGGNVEQRGVAGMVQSMNKKVKAREPMAKNVAKLQKREEKSIRVSEKELMEWSKTNSLISTNQSVNTTIASYSQKYISEAEKRSVVGKVRGIQQKIQQKQITAEVLQELLRHVQAVDRMLESF